MYFGAQVRGARAMLDWSREKLAEESGLSPLTISKVESNPEVRPLNKTVDSLKRTFGKYGIEFIENGVRFRDDALRVLEGENVHLQMLDDIFYTLKGQGEALFFYSSDTFDVQGEYEAEVRLRESGIKFRSIIKEGKSKTLWPRHEYRQIPSKYFHHNLLVIYGNKVAQVLDSGRRILIIHNDSFAATARNTFDLIWTQSPMPPKEPHHEG